MSKHYKAFPNFSDKELACQHCGKFNDSPEFIKLMGDVQAIRTKLKVPISISSGYRCEDHPIEARKIAKGGVAGHHSHAAVDLQVHTNDALKVLTEALSMEGCFTGIGIDQKGSYNRRFIHLDNRTTTPTIWSY